MNRPYHTSMTFAAFLAALLFFPACSAQHGMWSEQFGAGTGYHGGRSSATGGQPASHGISPQGYQGTSKRSHDLSAAQQSTKNGIVVKTHDDASFYFQDDNWRLTYSGIAGTAVVTTAEGLEFSADTTLSYLNASSAASVGRSKSTSQFLLTILGIILVIGLAAIILYAAFLATDW